MAIKNVNLTDKNLTLFSADLVKKDVNPFIFTEIVSLTEYSLNLKSFYEDNGEYVLISNHGNVYTLKQKKLTHLSDFNYQTNTKSIVVKRNGKNALLLINENGACFPFLGENVIAPHGDYYLYKRGVLYVSIGDELYLSKPYMFDDYNGFSPTEAVLFSEDYGKIVGLSENENAIFVFLEKAIYKLEIKGDEIGYELTKLDCVGLNILEDSVRQIGDYVYFISANALCVLRGDRVEELLDVSFGACKRVFVLDEYYIVETQGEIPCYKCVNTITKEIKEIKGVKFLSSLGHVVINNVVYKASVRYFNEKTDGDKPIELELDFDTKKPKAITRIEVLAKSPIKLNVKGDFGEREVSLSEDYCVVNCNLVSRTFTFIITGKVDGLKKLNITYRIYGE
jgi:copper chaperone CopZ